MRRRIHNLIWTGVFLVVPYVLTLFLGAKCTGDDLTGDWSLTLESKTPAWLRIGDTDGNPTVRMRIYVGSDGPHKVLERSHNRIVFMFKKNKKTKLSKKVEVKVVGTKLTGFITTERPSGELTRDSFIGTKIPSMPPKPDLSKVRFGHPVMLFNGKDMTGWRPHESDKINGWSVADGLLVNETPKIDFSATGAYANLRTENEFEDFWLHAEFLVDKDRNSGIYLRGMYEAQVVDRESRMQGIQGVGAIFGKIKPAKNAGKLGGQWQTYDLTLVDRHITVVLNGEKVIDNHPIDAPTAGAIFTNPSKPGPIYLQGDHTKVKYRNLYLSPVIKSQ